MDKFSKKGTPPTPVSRHETSENGATEELGKNEETPLPLRALMIPRVLIAAGNYATLSLVDIAFKAIQPLFFATPIELGGLGLDPPRIGNILSVYGVANGLFQVFFFADLHDRYGSKVIYSIAMASGIPTMLTFPLINALARTQGLTWMVWSVVGLQLVLSMVLFMAYCEPTFTCHESVLLIDVACFQPAFSSISRQHLRIARLLEPPTASLSSSCRSCAPLDQPQQRPCFRYP